MTTRWLATYLALQALGVLALPLAWSVCRHLPDRGVLAAKPLGLMMTGLTLWVGTSHGLLCNDLGGTVLSAALAGGMAFAAGRHGLRRDASGGRPLLEWLRAHKVLLLAGEAVFVAVFATWSVVRAHDPAAAHTEQPMDLMLVTAAAYAPTLPLPDPWLSGHAVGYYYFGHWLVATLGRLAGQPPEVAYTLGQAAWYGLLALGCFGVGANLALTSASRRAADAIVAGLLAVVTVALAGNLQGTLDVAQRAGLDLRALAAGRARYNFSPPPDPWWWRSSRVLEDVAADGTHVEVIDEVPAFSYVLGDNHAHVLAQPFVLLALALALNRFLARGRPGPVEAALYVATIAAIAFVNPADLPGAALLALGATWASARREGSSGLAVAALGTLALGAGIVLLIGPFLATAQSQVRGLLPNVLHPTATVQVALMFGSLLPGVLLLFDADSRPDRRVRGIAIGVCVLAPALAVGAMLLRADGPSHALGLERWAAHPWTLLGAGGLLGALAARLLGGRGTPGMRVAWAMASLGCASVLAPEIVYLHDAFGSRMNTVFKLYYQAWLLLGLAGAFALAQGLRHTSRLRRHAARGGIALAASGLVFTAAAAWDVTDGFPSASPTFDALAHVPADERAAIDWVRAHVPAGTVVLQAPGRSYAPDESRLSAATGRPTLLGWEGHERQWRGCAYDRLAAGREEGAGAVYGAADHAALLRALDAWQVRYLFVGPVERRRYRLDDAALRRMEEALDLVFEQGDVRLYRRRTTD